MVTLIDFFIASTLIFIVLTFGLYKLRKGKKSIPIIGNNLFDLILIMFIVGPYGGIFNGGKIIEQLNLVRNEDLQLMALFFALLYGIIIVSFRPKI